MSTTTKKQIKNLRAIINKMDPETSAAVIAELEAAIAEAEASEEEITLDMIQEMINKRLDALKPKVDEEEIIEIVENKLKDSIHQMKLDIKNDLKNNSMSAAKKSKSELKEIANALGEAILNSSNKNEYKTNVKKVVNDLVGYPDPVSIWEEISMQWFEESETKQFFDLLRYFGVENVVLPYTGDDWSVPDANARIHTKGTTKTPQTININTVQLLGEMIYKWLPLDRATLLSRTPESRQILINWVMMELPRKVYEKIEMEYLIGHAGTFDAAPGAAIQGIVPAALQSVISTGDLWRKVENIATATTETVINGLLSVMADMNYTSTNRRLYLTPDIFKMLTSRVYATGGTPIPVSKQELADQFNCPGGIYIRPYLDSNISTVKAIFYDPAQAARIGSDIFGDQWTIHEKNQEGYMAELLIAGAPHELASVGILTVG